MNVFDNIAVPLYISSNKYNELKKKVYEAVEKVGLQSILYNKVNELSGGQRQRVAIARAIVNNPKIILADEPTGALDSDTAKYIMKTLLELNEMDNTTIIIVTHDNDIAKLSNKKLILSDVNLFNLTSLS